MDLNPQSVPVLRVGAESDAANVSVLHRDQISEGFLSSLGSGFLRLLYRRIVRTPNSFLLVAEDRGRPVGFIAGSTDVRGLYRDFAVRDGFSVVLHSAPRLMRSWRSVLRALGHGTTELAAEAELLAVAVDPSAQSRGTGGLLVDGFLAELRARQVGSAHVVVAADNQRAIALYERCGFRTAAEFELHAGATSLDMRWPSPDETPE